MRKVVLGLFTVSLYAVATYQGVNALEETFALAKNYDVPHRDKSVIVTNEGYYPKAMSAFVGEKVRFFVTSTTKKKECFILRDTNVFLSAVKGQVSEAEYVFNEPGIYEYYCPTGQLRGSLTILEKPKQNDGRELASDESVVKVWMPREE